MRLNEHMESYISFSGEQPHQPSNKDQTEEEQGRRGEGTMGCERRVRHNSRREKNTEQAEVL